jgi:hypothetical protein
VLNGRSGYRESELPEVPPGRGDPAVAGRRWISVIGIDRYQSWNPLRNAVSDARGVLAAFAELGFVSIAAPLLDAAATGDAIRRLPSGLAVELDANDSLVVFFAGHGHTTTARFADGLHISKGYLIPVDADRPASRAEGPDHTWQRVEHWLTTIAELPARHILVILDSCQSGIALSRGVQHRGVGVRADAAPVPSHERRSRRVLASALDDQSATDSGPVPGHSVFTSSLIEALRGGARPWCGGAATLRVNELAAYVQRRVEQHSGQRQMPSTGWLELDDSGELELPLGRPAAIAPPPGPEASAARGERAPRADRRPHLQLPADPRTGSASTRDLPGPSVVPACPPSDRPDRAASAAEPSVVRAREIGVPRRRTEGWALDPVLAAALDRHREERRRGARVLTIVSGAPLAAQASWGMWAARHGYLTLATQAVGLDGVVAELLAQTPWLRCVAAARERLAAAARIDVAAVDASLDARSIGERRTWIDDVAGRDPHARVSGWLLSWLRCGAASVPDLTTAPVRGGELLAIACDLAAPTAVLLFHPTPDDGWFERAIVTAAQLIDHMPAHSVAVTAPDELVTRGLREQRRGAAWTMARQGHVRVDALGRRLPGRARASTMRALFEALGRDPRTRGRFALDAAVEAADGPAIDVALIAHEARIAVELDAWYHFHDPEGYRRDRVQDTRLSRAGYFVLRFPAEDVDDRLASTIEHLVIALASRRAVRAPLKEDLHVYRSR